MIKGAFKPLKTLHLVTWDGLVHQRVELLLLPSVAVCAVLKALAALFVASDEGAALPIFTKLRVIPEERGLTPEVLEVMRVHALRLVMLVIVGAPLSLEIEQVKIEVAALRQKVVD